MLHKEITLYHTADYAFDRPAPVNFKNPHLSGLTTGFMMSSEKKIPAIYAHNAIRDQRSGFVYETTLKDMSAWVFFDQPPAPALFAAIKKRFSQEDPVAFKLIDRMWSAAATIPTMQDIYSTVREKFESARVNNILMDCGIKGYQVAPTKFLFLDVTQVPPLKRHPVGPATEKVMPQPAIDLTIKPATRTVPFPDSHEAFLQDYYPTNNFFKGITSSVTLWKNRDTGNALIVKQGAHPDACEEEYLANQLYRAFGVDVPEARLLKGTHTVPLLAMEYIEGQTLEDLRKSFNLTAENETPQSKALITANIYSLYRHISLNSPIDMLLANYDVVTVHNANIIIRQDTGSPCRIDLGASLRFHCNGALKITNNHFSFLDTLRSMTLYGTNIPENLVEYEWGEKTDCHLRFRQSLKKENRGFIDLLNNQEILDRLEQARQDMPKVRDIAPKAMTKTLEGRLDHMTRHFESLVKTSARYQRRKPATPTSQPG